MAIQSNFPAIKPSLNLDFANTEALDPRITFTRASTATYYNGVTTAKAEENLLLRSQDYSATWTVTNLTPVTGKTAPDTTSTATEFTATAANAVLTQGFTAIAGSYTFSVFLRRVTGSGDIQIAADNGTWTTKVITGTWARYDVTQTVAAGSKTAGVRVVTDTDAIEVWGAQLEQRDAVTSYTPTTTQTITNYIPVLLTAATNAPRFDHNPTTGESLGLLIEEQRTNLILRSEEFDNASWTKTASSITANTVIAPDGTLTADLVINQGVVTSLLQQQVSVPASSTTDYYVTIYAKKGTATYFTFNCYYVGAAENNVNFNFDTQVVTGAPSSDFFMESVGNGWYRCGFRILRDGTGTETAILFRMWESGRGVSSGNTYFWGAQLEAGAFSTSYIKTVAATATRSADAASMTGTNFSSWYNQAQGTLYAEATTRIPYTGTNLFPRICEINDAGSTNNAIRMSYGVLSTETDFRSSVVVNGVSQYTSDSGESNGGKQIIAYKTDDFSSASNGTLLSVDTSGTVPVVNTLFLGGYTPSNFDGNINGHIRKIAYYPLRLTNAQLQALTG
jgi:hypothetical protein